MRVRGKARPREAGELDLGLAPSRERPASGNPEEFFPTTSNAVRALVRAHELGYLELPGGRWLEPAAGDGAIIRGFAHRFDVVWDAVELRRASFDQLRRLPGLVEIDCPTNYLQRPAPAVPYRVAITNPPFSLSLRFVGKLLLEAEVVLMLLRLDWLGSLERNEFLRRCPPDVFPLAQRPSFDGSGNTDKYNCAWFKWPGGGGGRPWGRIFPLAPAGPPQLELKPGRAG
jgi:hypothetical protein